MANRRVKMAAKKVSNRPRAKVAAKQQERTNTKTKQPQVVDLTQDEPPEMDPLESDDYFEVLGIPRSASEADVKKAYRKLAVQWHPDKNRSHPRAEEFFKKISEAYEVLSDPEKRKLYERYGKAGLQGGSPSEDHRDHFTGFSTQHAKDIFDAFFGGSDPFEAFFGGRRGRRDPFESMGFGFGGMGGASMLDSFFSDGFGDMGGFSSSMSSSSSTFTDRNGHVVTQKTTTTVGADGRAETVTEEYRNGKLVNSTSSSSTSRLAGAGRMQLEGNSSRALPSQTSQVRTQSTNYTRRGSNTHPKY